MKKNILFISLSIILFSTGCLKEKKAVEVTDNTSRVITEFTNGDSSTLNSLALPIATGLQDADLAEIRILPRSNATKNVDVKIELNPGLIDAYNIENGTDYEVPPVNVYSFTTHTYTLTPQEKSTNAKISIDPSLLLGNLYALGFTITSVSDGEISELRKDYIVELKAKNAYDGDYTSNGYVYHPTLPRTIDARPKTLETFSPTSVVCELGDLGANGYFAVFDVLASNDVDITIAPGAAGVAYEMFTAGLPAANPGYTPQWAGSAECNNTYDPATQSFKVRYGYLGATGYRVTEEIITRD